MELLSEDLEMQLKEHIAIFHRVLPKDLCKQYINYFEDCYSDENNFFGENNKNDLHTIKDGKTDFNLGSLERDDVQMFLNLHPSNLKNICHEYINVCFNRYLKEYPCLINAKLWSHHVKLQKTPPGGGFHVWHYENPEEMCHRAAVWMIYLNDIPDGEGETEFLYQRLRVKPKAGTVVIWPAGYTHVHRGNTVFTRDKYILTGWFSYKSMI